MWGPIPNGHVLLAKLTLQVGLLKFLYLKKILVKILNMRSTILKNFLKCIVQYC